MAAEGVEAVEAAVLRCLSAIPAAGSVDADAMETAAALVAEELRSRQAETASEAAEGDSELLSWATMEALREDVEGSLTAAMECVDGVEFGIPLAAEPVADDDEGADEEEDAGGVAAMPVSVQLIVALREAGLLTVADDSGDEDDHDDEADLVAGG